MCKASIMLCLFVILSYVFDYVVVALIFGKYVDFTQAVIVRFFTLLGVPELLSIVTVRNLITSETFYDFCVMLTVLLSMVVPSAFFAKSAKLSGEDCFTVRGKLIKGFLPTVAFCQLAISAVLEIAYFFSGHFVSPIFSPAIAGRFLSGSTALADMDIFNFVMSVIYMCVFVPFAEEFVFRGVFLTYLKRYGIAFGMVASSLLFGIAKDDPVQAAEIANYAAGVVVGKLGTAAVTADELKNALTQA